MNKKKLLGEVRSIKKHVAQMSKGYLSSLG